MSRTFDVDIYTTASASVSVSISAERLAEIAAEADKDVADLTIDDLVDEIVESFEAPKICAQCTGWGRDYGLELGDEWDLASGDRNLASAITEK